MTTFEDFSEVNLFLKYRIMKISASKSDFANPVGPNHHLWHVCVKKNLKKWLLSKIFSEVNLFLKCRIMKISASESVFAKPVGPNHHLWHVCVKKNLKTWQLSKIFSKVNLFLKYRIMIIFASESVFANPIVQIFIFDTIALRKTRKHDNFRKYLV